MTKIEEIPVCGYELVRTEGAEGILKLNGINYEKRSMHTLVGLGVAEIGKIMRDSSGLFRELKSKYDDSRELPESISVRHFVDGRLVIVARD